MLASKLLSPMVKLFGDKRRRSEMTPVEEQEQRLAKYAEGLKCGYSCSVPKKNSNKPKKRFSETNISVRMKNPIIILKD